MKNYRTRAVVMVIALVAVYGWIAVGTAAGLSIDANLQSSPVEVDMTRVWGLVVEFLSGANLRVLLGLIILDVMLGVAAALKRGQFQWEEVGRFYSTDVLPGVIGYMALYVAFGLIPALDGVLGTGLQWLAWGVLVTKFTGSIFGALVELGVPKPSE